MASAEQANLVENQTMPAFHTRVLRQTPGEGHAPSLSSSHTHQIPGDRLPRANVKGRFSELSPLAVFTHLLLKLFHIMNKAGLLFCCLNPKIRHE